jgi:hypothetical protein
MGGSWVEVNDDREPAKIASENPFPVKNAEFDTEPVSLGNSELTNLKGSARWIVH